MLFRSALSVIVVASISPVIVPPAFGKAPSILASVVLANLSSLTESLAIVAATEPEPLAVTSPVREVIPALPPTSLEP